MIPDFDESLFQAQTEITASLNVIQLCISRLRHAMSMNQKQGKFVQYEMKERELDRQKIICLAENSYGIRTVCFRT